MMSHKPLSIVRAPLLLLGCLLVFPFQVLAQGVVSSDPVGKILFSKGPVQLIRSDGVVLPLKRGDGVRLKDTLVTGQDARILIRFSDATQTVLGAHTEFQVTQYDLLSEPHVAVSDRVSVATYRLIKGVFKTVTGAISKREGGHRVETALGTIGIRGTTYWGGYLEPNKLDVLLIEGSRAVEVYNTQAKVVLKEGGQGTSLLEGKPPSLVKFWPRAKVKRALETVSWPEIIEQ